MDRLARTTLLAANIGQTMATLENSSTPRQQLRLGTRSCVECRRRKVRCEWEKSQQACRACLLHKTPCRAQRAKEVGENDSASLSRRLAELETEVRQLRSNLSASSSSHDGHSSEQKNKAVSLLQNSEDASTSYSWEENSTPESRYEGLANNAPLIHFANEALGAHLLDEKGGVTNKQFDAHVEEALYKLRNLLPDSQTLHSILLATDTYWRIWPKYYIGPSHGDQLKPGFVGIAVLKISDALNSSDVCNIAKALLWLALCIQQLPPQWETINCIKLPASAEILVEVYMKTAKTLLPGDVDSTKVIECHLFRYKLLINQGKARQGWSLIRKALNTALLLGLNREHQGEEWEGDMWNELRQADTLLSLVFGLPVITVYGPRQISSETSPSTSARQSDLINNVFNVAALVNERNQKGAMDDYATTIRLDQDWRQCWDVISARGTDAGTNFESVYHSNVIRLIICLIGKFIHLPYLLKARSDTRFSHSQLTVMQTSKEIMRAYMMLRENSTTRLVMCELMDFHAFGAAFTIAVELLSRPKTSNNLEEIELWHLVARLATTLRQASVNLQCQIAAQGAHVLDMLHAIHKGSNKAPIEFEADIPYFGKIRISAINTNTVLQESPSLSSPTSLEACSFDIFTDFFEFPFLGDFDPSAIDLNSDWGIVNSFFEIEAA